MAITYSLLNASKNFLYFKNIYLFRDSYKNIKLRRPKGLCSGWYVGDREIGGQGTLYIAR